MTAKRLYLHIGMPKTGTDSIQRWFAGNAEALLRLHGLYYLHGYRPHRARIPQHITPTHCPWLFPLTPEGTDFLREKSREAAATNYTSLLISDEAAVLPTKRLANAVPVLREIFPGHELRIILVLRRADDWCKSYYGQMCRQAREHDVRSFAAYCDSPFGLEEGLFALPRTLQALADAVGKENLLLRIYDRKRMKNGSALDDFADIFGIGIPLGVPEEVCSDESNPSLPAEALPYLAPLADQNSQLPLDLRNQLLSLLKESFEQSRNFQVKSVDAARISRAVDEVEEWLPGYKKLYQEREFSLDWPELEVNPALVALSEVLYSLVDRLNQVQNEQRKISDALHALLAAHNAQRKRDHPD